jgi:hypothetical protein
MICTIGSGKGDLQQLGSISFSDILVFKYFPLVSHLELEICEAGFSAIL